MPIIYDENATGSGSTNVPYDKWKATDRYLEHYANMLLLDFIAKSSKDGREAAQARSEILLAERKMKFWQHHPNYEQAAVTRGVEKLKQQCQRR